MLWVNIIYIPSHSTGKALQRNTDITQCSGDGGDRVAKDSTHHVTTSRGITVQGNAPNNASADRYAESETF